VKLSTVFQNVPMPTPTHPVAYGKLATWI